jgi:phosphate-selective porin OprO/OprP
VPLVFDLGYMDVPFTMGEATSSNDIPFVERAAIVNVASNIFANDFRSALGVRSYDDRYWAGLYLTGPTSGTNHTTGEQIGIAARGTYNIWQSPDSWLHVGADAGALLKPPAAGGIRSITLADRPELRVDPTTILSTGSIGTAANPLTNAAVYGVEGAAAWRNFLVDVEYYRIDINRERLATSSFDGGYIQGSWIITGEQRKYSPQSRSHSRCRFSRGGGLLRRCTEPAGLCCRRTARPRRVRQLPDRQADRRRTRHRQGPGARRSPVSSGGPRVTARLI